MNGIAEEEKEDWAEQRKSVPAMQVYFFNHVYKDQQKNTGL